MKELACYALNAQCNKLHMPQPKRLRSGRAQRVFSSSQVVRSTGTGPFPFVSSVFVDVRTSEDLPTDVGRFAGHPSRRVTSWAFLNGAGMCRVMIFHVGNRELIVRGWTVKRMGSSSAKRSEKTWESTGLQKTGLGYRNITTLQYATVYKN